MMWRIYRLSFLQVGLVVLLIIALLGCNAAPPIPRITSSDLQSSQLNSNSSDLSPIDLVSFETAQSGTSQSPSISTKTLHFQQASTDNVCIPTRKCRIKVRQVGALGVDFLTFVVIRDSATAGAAPLRAWYGYGSYDILWDGTDDNQKQLPGGTYAVILQIPSKFYRAQALKPNGLHGQATNVLPWIGRGVCASDPFACLTGLVIVTGAAALLFVGIGIGLPIGQYLSVSTDVGASDKEEEIAQIQNPGSILVDATGPVPRVPFPGLPCQAVGPTSMFDRTSESGTVLLGPLIPGWYYVRFPGFRLSLTSAPARSGSLFVPPNTVVTVTAQVTFAASSPNAGLIGDLLVSPPYLP